MEPRAHVLGLYNLHTPGGISWSHTTDELHT